VKSLKLTIGTAMTKSKVWNIRPENFCIAPWTQLRIGTEGAITNCIRQLEGGKISETFDLAKEYNTSGDFTEVRNSFLTGSFSKLCVRCTDDTVANGAHRKAQNFKSAIHDLHFNESLKQSPSYVRLKSDDILPVHVLVLFNNECNLACRHCQPLVSSTLAKALNGTVNVSGWSTDKDKWENFKQFILSNNSLELLQINGGEPFLQPEFYEILDIIKDRTDLQLVITTNGTVYDNSTMEKLKRFKSCFIDISIECFHKNNDYIRVGSNFETMKENLEKFRAHSTDSLRLALHATPQVYSIDKLYTIFDYCIEHNLGLVGNYVFDYELQVHVLPEDYRSQLYETVYKKYENTTHPTVKIVHSRVKEMLLKKEEKDEQSIINFVNRTIQHDLLLGTSFSAEYPHLVKYFKNYGF
jgi:MoaA/NifB/PqqE/SkfB family radical SAM enzyme